MCVFVTYDKSVFSFVKTVNVLVPTLASCNTIQFVRSLSFFL